jgi:CRISPR-associated endonuclease/helicase Cas3
MDSANSVFVLDELHSYDPQRLGYLLATASFWCRLGGRVAVLSATLPDRLCQLVTAALTHPSAGSSGAGTGGADADAAVHVVEADYAAAPRRHRVRVREDELTGTTVRAEMLGRIEAGESVLVVANNVGQAHELYEELAPAARERFGSDGVWLLHSRFRRCDRKTIETAVLERHRAGRRADLRRGGLVVATQVVEVSLDVDFDVLFTSGAPLDALVQRFGRVNRLGSRPPADVIVCRPEMRSRRGKGPALFADGVYPEVPSVLAWEKLLSHDGQEATEGLFADWLNEVYSSDWGDEWANEVDRHRERFEELFLDFRMPFSDRSELEERFDDMFEGTEAVLSDDVEEFASLLASVPGSSRAGRLLADDLLLPMPSYARTRVTWNRDLGAAVVDGDYDGERGLVALRGRQRELYAPGEVI